MTVQERLAQIPEHVEKIAVVPVGDCEARYEREGVLELSGLPVVVLVAGADTAFGYTEDHLGRKRFRGELRTSHE